MSWKPEYLILIVISTLVDYLVCLRMGGVSVKRRRRKYLLISLFANLGLLFIFKYYNFFFQSLGRFMNFYFFYIPFKPGYLDVLVPVGISFYTFQTLSYTIDVYRGRITPEKNLGIFALYVSFFPQLVAGPIERASNLLPQFFEKIDFDYARVISGVKIMIWGFFLKVVVADRAALMVDQVFKNPGNYTGLPLVLATYLFSFQIYGDFAGYSFIAIGAARVMGFRLMDNFMRPYFARSIPDFWRRWHISLSTWCRDYIYLPLGGNKVAVNRLILNIFIVFFLSGLWHGAAWTFVFWGVLHAFYYILTIVVVKIKGRIDSLDKIRIDSPVATILSICLTFHMIAFSWIFFRAKSLGDAFYIITHLTTNLFDLSNFHPGVTLVGFWVTIFFILCMEFIHLLQEKKSISRIKSPYHGLLKGVFYMSLILAILLFGVLDERTFIYFQF